MQPDTSGKLAYSIAELPSIVSPDFNSAFGKETFVQ